MRNEKTVPITAIKAIAGAISPTRGRHSSAHVGDSTGATTLVHIGQEAQLNCSNVGMTAKSDARTR